MISDNLFFDLYDFISKMRIGSKIINLIWSKLKYICIRITGHGYLLTGDRIIFRN